MATQLGESGVFIVFDHKTILTITAFLVIGGLLAGQALSGVRGRLAARMVLVAYLLLTLGYPGVKFVTDVIMALRASFDTPSRARVAFSSSKCVEIDRRLPNKWALLRGLPPNVRSHRSCPPRLSGLPGTHVRSHRHAVPAPGQAPRRRPGGFRDDRQQGHDPRPAQDPAHVQRVRRRVPHGGPAGRLRAGDHGRGRPPQRGRRRRHHRHQHGMPGQEGGQGRRRFRR